MRQGQWQRQGGGSGRLLFALVGGATAFALASFLRLGKAAQGGETPRRGKNAAYNPDEPAASREPGAPGTVRSAGPESTRNGRNGRWDKTDEELDESFPASDPPANY
ncbi:MAG: hypothetical protein ACFCUR_17050 [Rhodomicrobiaceae bacterium]